VTSAGEPRPTPPAPGPATRRPSAASVEERKIANVSRHKDLPVLRGYIRAATAFDDVGEVL
jgi:hypothetical protein